MLRDSGARDSNESDAVNVVNYCATCLVFRGDASAAFSSPESSAGIPESGSRQLGRVRAATQVNGGHGSRQPGRRRRPPRPVASWGPRYRYDVDIWRALLLHPRPARISSLRGERVVLVTSNAAAGADLNRDIQAHCSETAFCGGDRRRLSIRYCLIIRRQYRSSLVSHL